MEEKPKSQNRQLANGVEGNMGADPLRHTYSGWITEVRLWLDVRFQLLLLMTHIHPMVFHDLLTKKESVYLVRIRHN